MTFIDFVIFALYAMLIATALLITRQRDLFAASVITGVFSLLCAGIFTLTDAVDVAFTEAAVGAGMATVLFLATLSLVGRKEKPHPLRSPIRRVVPLVVVTLTGFILVVGTLDMPAFGDATAPIHTNLGALYIQRIPLDVDVPNLVTAILGSYRAFDTLGELAVVFTAGVGVTLLLARERSEELPKEGSVKRSPSRPQRVREMPVLRATTKVLIPLVILFAFYVQAHGDFGPGGGFQAGVIFASAMLMFGLTYSPALLEARIGTKWLERAAAVGLLLYGGVGVSTIVLGANFLDYDILAHDPTHGQHRGLLLIELGVGITVSAVMVMIYSRFALRGGRR